MQGVVLLFVQFVTACRQSIHQRVFLHTESGTYYVHVEVAPWPTVISAFDVFQAKRPLARIALDLIVKPSGEA